MVTPDEIRRALAAPPPALVETPRVARAAVALVLRGAPGRGAAADSAPTGALVSPSELEVLLIERARRRGDPWSGHMAFPGGRLKRIDRSVRDAAERETLEEVGISLHGADALGRLNDLEGRHAGRRLPLVISAWVYSVDETPSLRLSDEVAAAVWVPLGRFIEDRHQVEHAANGTGYPGVEVETTGRRVVWGLTYRFLEIFLARVGRPLPNRWSWSLESEMQAAGKR